MNLKKNKITALTKLFLGKLNAISCSFFVLNFLSGRKKILLSFFVGLFLSLGSYVIFLDQESLAQNSLPNCQDLPGNIAADPGNNCLFSGLPLCKNVNNPRPRINCHDLIDLPLCSQIVTANNSVEPGKNCVELCSHSHYDNPNPNKTPPLVRGRDFAIFNEDCIRFCDDVENGINARDSGSNRNCIRRKCHQLPNNVHPIVLGANKNCELSRCNLLTADELNKNKFETVTRQYCDGSNLKCYEFSKEQLPFVHVRDTNPTCQIHDCKPTVSSCGADDTLNVTNKGQAYIDEYEKYVNGGFDISSSYSCNNLGCKPVVKTHYRCTDSSGKITGSSNDTVRNNMCDVNGAGSSCSNGYCYKTIDCNLSANASLTECQIGTSSTPSGNFQDPYDSWFYRPKPLDKAVRADGSGILRNFESNICYTRRQMEKDHGWGRRSVVDFGLLGKIDMGWFHDYLAMDSRSPGWCGARKDGHRGTGYSYICGTGGNLYNKPSDHAAYYAGYVRTKFGDNTAKHVIRVCTRYTNTITLNACGKRECGITAAFVDGSSGASGIRAQTCGGDVCHDLEIEESDPYECEMTDYLAQVTGSAKCSKKTDTNIRTRVVQYDDRICAFVDSRGQLAYKKMFMKGTEYLEDGKTCVNDHNGKPIDTDGDGIIDEGCHGYDSNKYEGLADKWRAIYKVPYVLNNRPQGDGYQDANGDFIAIKGYIDKDGKVHKMQECPKVSLRIPPPNLYNLANMNNSDRLFLPPLYIRSAIDIKGGSEVVAKDGQLYGTTDFYEPEIKVQFGDKIFRMSLPYNAETGIDGKASTFQNDANSPSYYKEDIIQRGKEYIADLYVAKEYNVDSSSPLFCLYRKVQNINGTAAEPYRVGCVPRKYPDIDNKDERLALANVKPRIIVTDISSAQSSSYDNAKIKIRSLVGFGKNNQNDRCGVGSTNNNLDDCTDIIEIGNPDYSTPNCSRDLERYQICAQREECSQLFIECVKNEIDYNNALNSAASTGPFEVKRKFCSETLIPFCSAKAGILDSSNISIYNLPASRLSADPKLYGWYNELCIVSGFESKLKDIVAYSLPDNKRGKCIVDPLSPYLTDSDPNTNCDDGGFAPNCLCIEAPEGYVTSSGEVIRKETPREAGLCVDMPVPKTCLAINYNPNPNLIDPNDPDYAISSLGKMNYNDYNGVHSSHQDRSSNSARDDSGHAEFPVSFFGVNDVRGECKGFWTYDKNAFGLELYPSMSCIDDGGQAKWDKNSLRNPCVRYSCPVITTSDPDSYGNYDNDYANNEVGEDKGLRHGFALWSKYTKTNDFMELRTANSCITGFKPKNSTPIYSNSTNKITGYSGGILPSRDCDQLGNWQDVTNQCERITCPAVNPPTPSGVSDLQAWNQWFESGGATFPSVNASRSSVRVQNESIAIGSCNNNLGFFQSPGASPPSRKCNHLGNWEDVDNQCVSSCDAVLTNKQAANQVNGFAKWAKAQGNMTAAGIDGAFLGCANGYVTNPYPPILDKYGNLLPDANDLTRPAEDPKRMCRLGQTQQGTNVSVWTSAVNACINKCPGADYDSRMGVGITSHEGKDGRIILRWPDGQFGRYSYVTNWNGQPEHLTAADFKENRTNRFYLVKRFCNPDGKWDDPEPLCSTNEGVIGRAKYHDSSKNSGYQNSIVADTSDRIEGSCVDGNWKSNNDQGPLPKRRCTAPKQNGELIINETYLKLSNGTADCEPIKCGPKNEIYNNKVIVDINGYHSVGQQISLQCFRSTTQTTVHNLFGIPSQRTVPFHNTTKGGPNPVANCKADGTWEYLNADSCKKYCVVPGRTQNINAYAGEGGGIDYSFDSFVMSYGEEIQFNAYDGNSRRTAGGRYYGCATWAYAAKCGEDGKVIVKERTFDHRKSKTQGCDIYTYNFNRGSWNEIIRGYRNQDAVAFYRKDNVYLHPVDKQAKFLNYYDGRNRTLFVKANGSIVTNVNPNNCDLTKRCR